MNVHFLVWMSKTFWHCTYICPGWRHHWSLSTVYRSAWSYRDSPLVYKHFQCVRVYGLPFWILLVQTDFQTRINARKVSETNFEKHIKWVLSWCKMTSNIWNTSVIAIKKMESLPFFSYIIRQPVDMIMFAVR